MRVAISGASGSVGRALRASLELDGHTVLPLVRREPGPGEIGWSVEEQRIDHRALEGVDAVIHLAGATIGQRWTAKAMRAIKESRVRGTRLLCRALATLERKPGVLVASSAVGIYGHTGDTEVDESSPPGDNFLAEVGVAWEAETAPAREAGIRVVNLRSGLALSTEHGLMAEQILPAKLGMLGPVAGGRQWVPWVAMEDLVGAYRHALVREELTGPVIATSPNPVQQGEFAKELAGALGRPALVPAPGFALRLSMGQMAQELVIEGQRCRPRRLQETGFEWDWPELGPAIRHTLDLS